MDQSASSADNGHLASESNAELAGPVPAVIDVRPLPRAWAQAQPTVVVVVPDDDEDEVEYEVEHRGVGSSTPVSPATASPTRQSTPVETFDEGVEAGVLDVQGRQPSPFDSLPQEVRVALAEYLNHTPHYFAVVRGKAVGVFNTWLVVQHLVIGVPGSDFARYDTFEDALSHFTENAAEGEVVIIP
ncbi:hypothetical protein EVJ58_g8191 [Rhodofomes roseus]|uniref:Ribonuclease H1 N-terminal domain-containing protein n=1 Tax=Rhodofomes roseus TaxID=34475 RepID=A0A4Y9XZK7_9APHY|nr:hypothetical protein EVJ58_g8191 [Rhodofomes roseus]